MLLSNNIIILLNLLTTLTIKEICASSLFLPNATIILNKIFSEKDKNNHLFELTSKVNKSKINLIEKTEANLVYILLKNISRNVIKINDNNHRKHYRKKRRIPLSSISKLLGKLTGRAKVSPTIDKVDDVFLVGSKMAMKNGGDKIDDLILSNKNFGNTPIRGMNRRNNYRPYEPPQFYTAKDEIQKAKSQVLTGTNLALAAGGIATGAWYFSGEHTSFITIIFGILLISLLFTILIFLYCFFFRRKKRGYYAVNNDTYALMSFVKKFLFYLF
ncbi:hypothetical protein Mgra_00008081 [Meloidogyne graminicola]|uniref:Uncharacterized protein n=1 Tax=Meloidogyne graminicola TaxID=189291 RepID=A0A8S9ZGX0_9BILA|nr:hypothetical protein Mgra_00008081 [Meloidogyne graminicola]